MKVSATAPIRAASGPRRAERGGDGSFARHLGAGVVAGPGALAATHALAGIDALLLAQEGDDPAERRRRAVARADDLLDELESLRLALLDGTLPRTALETLAARLRSQAGAADDPRLQAVLDEIELRAAVELAKLESAAR